MQYAVHSACPVIRVAPFIQISGCMMRVRSERPIIINGRVIIVMSLALYWWRCVIHRAIIIPGADPECNRFHFTHFFIEGYDFRCLYRSRCHVMQHFCGRVLLFCLCCLKIKVNAPHFSVSLWETRKDFCSVKLFKLMQYVYVLFVWFQVWVSYELYLLLKIIFKKMHNVLDLST